jgi:hypothetical protein
VSRQRARGNNSAWLARNTHPFSLGRWGQASGRCMSDPRTRNALVWTAGAGALGLLQVGQWRSQGALPSVCARWVRARQERSLKSRRSPRQCLLRTLDPKPPLPSFPDVTSTHSDPGSVQSGSFWHPLVFDTLQHQMCSRQARISPSSPSAAAHPPLSSASYHRERRDTFGLHIPR